MKFLKYGLLFLIGGGAYVLLEILYRGYSHISMFFAGGLCFLLIGGVRNLPLGRGVATGVAAITSVELITGLLVNRDYTVWDYRDQPGNFLGQICPAFVAIWIPVTLAGMFLYRWAETGIDRLLGSLRSF